MTMDVRINNQSLRELLNRAPRINDQAGAACRTLELSVRNVEGLENYQGQPVELWYGADRWFFGFMFRRGFDDKGNIRYVAYDPLYYFSKNADDYYIKNMTATQGFKYLADLVGIEVASLANTGAVFKSLYYPDAQPDKIAVDMLVRTYDANGKKFWYRYMPGVAEFGLKLFERVVPKEVWSFQIGVNLSRARHEDSIEDTATVVKLINRETGKIVTRVDSEKLKQFGQLKYFEEVDKDQADTMERQAQGLLKQLARVNVTSSLTGINPNQVMPQLFSGDTIYVEEPSTKLFGAYHIRNISQTFISDNLVELGIDVQEAPDIPAIQYEDALNSPKPKAKAGTGVQEEPIYDEKLKGIMDKYGL